MLGLQDNGIGVGEQGYNGPGVVVEYVCFVDHHQGFRLQAGGLVNCCYIFNFCFNIEVTILKEGHRAVQGDQTVLEYIITAESLIVKGAFVFQF